jgi:hypothetical protein
MDPITLISKLIKILLIELREIEDDVSDVEPEEIIPDMLTTCDKIKQMITHLKSLSICKCNKDMITYLKLNMVTPCELNDCFYEDLSSSERGGKAFHLYSTLLWELFTHEE